MTSLGQIIRDTWALLTFRLTKAEFDTFGRGHLYFGLLCAWAAGVGRFWDTAMTSPWARLGLGSVVYPFVLAGLVWLLAWPLKPRAFRYTQLLTFIALTSPLAWIYAPLVARFAGMELAETLRVWALALVSLWRLSLLGFFFRRCVGLTWPTTVVATGTPVIFIVAGLTFFNLHFRVMNFMRGREGALSEDDASNMYVLLLAVGALYSALPVVVVWLTTVIWNKNTVARIAEQTLESSGTESREGSRRPPS